MPTRQAVLLPRPMPARLACAMLGPLTMSIHRTFARALGVVIPALALGLAGWPSTAAGLEAVDLELALAIDVLVGWKSIT